MKRLVFILLLIWSSNTVFSQNDSIFPNYESVFCTTNSWNVIGDTYTFPSDPYTDTLSVMFDDGNGFITYANLWLDNRKIWVKLIDPLNYVNTPYIIENFMGNDHDYPYEEFFLLYDFDHIDTIEIGDTVHNHYSHIYLADIDTVFLHGEQKKIYILGEGNTSGFVDYWMEGFGSLINPLAPLFYPWYMNCGCGMDVSYYDGTTVTYDSIKYGDLPFPYICDGYGNLESLVNEKVSIYPNPTSDNFTIQLHENYNTSTLHYKLMDLTGKIVSQGNITDNIISVSDIESGVYVVYLEEDGKPLGVRKVVVE